MLHVFIIFHIIHCRPELHMRPNFTNDLFYHNDILVYCILSIQQFITLADKTCKLPEDGVRAPKHVRVFAILILYCFYVQLLVY